jgi:vitamin B12 transporter
MNYWESHTQVAVRFRRFDRKRYAAFRSMHKVINIGVVTARYYSPCPTRRKPKR